MARGEYICFLDDDDFYLKDHLSVFKKEIINLGYPVAMFYTMPVSWSEESGRYTQRVLPPFNYSNPIAYLFYHKHGVPTPRVCVKKEILEKHLFNEKIRIGQDTELFLRIAAEYPVLPIQAFTAVQIRHSDNSGNLKNNTGLQRLAGYQYIFNNKNVARHIPWKLKREMMAYCYLRMTDHYAFTGNRWKTLRSSLIAFYYAPWDDQWKNKSAYIVYSIIGGRFFKRIRASLSK